MSSISSKKNRKQLDLRFHSSKVEFVCLFHGRNVGLKKSFRLCLTFSNFSRITYFQKFIVSNPYIKSLVDSASFNRCLSFSIYIFVNSDSEPNLFWKGPLFTENSCFLRWQKNLQYLNSKVRPS